MSETGIEGLGEADVPDGARPNPARMYDYALGGVANFEADRQAVHRALAVNPEGRLQSRANRAFLWRVVRHLAGEGVRQFIDLGSGVPTMGHVHEIAQQANPTSRVIYVDNEPVAFAYSRQLLAGVDGAAVLQVDLRNVRKVLDHPDTQRLIDLSQPVAIGMFAVLHFIMSDQEVADLVAAYRDTTVSGSYLAISHTCGADEPKFREIEKRYRTGTTMPFHNRTVEEVTALFDGYPMLDPGVVPVSDWHPEPSPDPNRPSVDAVIGGVGRRV